MAAARKPATPARIPSDEQSFPMSGGTVYVVDDNDDFRESIAWMLRGEGLVTIDFACPRAAIDELKDAGPDRLAGTCMLLDIRMPGMSGLEVHDLMRRERIAIPVVYMTGHADVALAVEAMKKGAVSFLEKPLQSDELYSAIDSALDASRAAPSDASEPAEGAGSDRCYRELTASLTPRETEVLDGIIDGHANKVIAWELGISVRTVEVHRSRVMRKIGVRSVPELVRRVMLARLGRVSG